MDTWRFRNLEQDYLWILAISVVETDYENKNKWLRYLISEKIPRLEDNLQLILYIRTTNRSLIPENLNDDQKLMSRIGQYNESLFVHIIRPVNFSKPKRIQRKRGYTDGTGNLNLAYDEKLWLKELSNDYTVTELQQQIDETRERLHQLEELLAICLEVPDWSIPSVED
jgi:hypothetical protein